MESRSAQSFISEQTSQYLRRSAMALPLSLLLGCGAGSGTVGPEISSQDRTPITIDSARPSASPSSTPTLESMPEPEVYIQRGDTGPAVKDVQAMLHAIGCPITKSQLTGTFGPVTESAVQLYEVNTGLANPGQASGIVNQELLQSLTEAEEDNVMYCAGPKPTPSQTPTPTESPTPTPSPTATSPQPTVTVSVSPSLSPKATPTGTPFIKPSTPTRNPDICSTIEGTPATPSPCPQPSSSTPTPCPSNEGIINKLQGKLCNLTQKPTTNRIAATPSPR